MLNLGAYQSLPQKSYCFELSTVNEKADNTCIGISKHTDKGRNYVLTNIQMNRIIKSINKTDNQTVNKIMKIFGHNKYTQLFRFTALLEFVRDYPGEQVPER